MQPILFFIILCIANFLFRCPELFSFGYLNDDAALIQGAIAAFSREGVLPLFFSSYGPDVIRPFQIIGFYLETLFFGIDPFPSHLISIGILSLSQTLIIFAIKRNISLLGAWVAVLPLGFSILAAEPNYWLSDRHDLYLLFFFSLSLLICSRCLFSRNGMKSANYGWWLLLLFSIFGCYYSNEKGVAVPGILVALVFLDTLIAKDTSILERSKRVFALIVLSTICTLPTSLCATVFLEVLLETIARRFFQRI